MAEKYYEGIGRRKEASARVRLMKGSGEFDINGKALEAYFTREGDPEAILEPLQVTNQERSIYDVSVLVNGGGVTGQRDAVRLGLSKALLEMEGTFRPVLRKKGLLTRDSRIKERKKPGLKRARKAPTYTKR
jgi:small subunit ribosomal protein S9